MRFLFSKQAERVVVRNTRSASVPLTQGGHQTSSPSFVVIPLAERKWGQHCGSACACVLRFEMGMDNEDRVVAANYRAKRLLPSHHHNNTTTNGRPSAFRSRRTGKVQFSNCTCETLHSLAKQTCHYAIGKRAGQIQTNLYSSPAVRRVSLGVQNLHPENGSGCYELVHSTLSATFDGYIPVKATSYSKDDYQRISYDEQDDEPPAPIFEPSTAVMWWDRATSTLDEITRKPSLFESPSDSTPTSASTIEPRPVDWLSYVDQMEEESA